jgi:succinate dehydrogenase / fumarate reductase iron-sulfur subunit
MKETWKITLLVSRRKGQEAPHFDKFLMDVSPDEYVLDAVERVWAFHDRSLCFAHACHHSTCGACGMRVNGVEKLTCITPIQSVTHDGGTLRVEPLRNFPVISDLAVDMGGLYRKMEMVGHHSVISVADEPAEEKLSKEAREEKREFMRLSDCIECGLCVSACPAAATNEDYIGPAPLAGSLIGDWNTSGYSQYLHGQDGNGAIYNLIDGEVGLWRCHSAFECTAVCPSNVNPAGRIMELRRQVLSARLKNLFR